MDIGVGGWSADVLLPLYGIQHRYCVVISIFTIKYNEIVQSIKHHRNIVSHLFTSSTLLFPTQPQQLIFSLNRPSPDHIHARHKGNKNSVGVGYIKLCGEKAIESS
jgi:hypothetical protein